jgi:hypothetical protein
VYGQGWDPATAGRTAASRTAELGWTPNAATRRFIVLDMEASVNSGWVAAFANAVRSAGYDVVVYGSAAFVHGNPVESGYWVALWDGRTDVPAGAVAHQYQANVAFGGTEVDYSMWEQAFLDRFGWGPRR